MQSGAVWLWRERRGAALGRCRNGGAQPRAGTLLGLAGDGVQIGGESQAAGPAAEPPPRTKSAEAARRAAGPAARNLPTAGACRGIKEK